MFACFAVLRGEKRLLLRLPAGQSEQGAAASPPPAALRRSRNAARRVCGEQFLTTAAFCGDRGKEEIPKAADRADFSNIGAVYAHPS